MALKILCRLRVSPLEESDLAEREIRFAFLWVELQCFFEFCRSLVFFCPGKVGPAEGYVRFGIIRRQPDSLLRLTKSVLFSPPLQVDLGQDLPNRGILWPERSQLSKFLGGQSTIVLDRRPPSALRS